MHLATLRTDYSERPGREVVDFLTGGGEMQALVRAKPWADTPLGPAEYWPQSLKTAVRIMLTSRFAMWLGWGDELTFFYNDAYRPTLGIKHGWALGAPAREVWREIWPDIGPRIERVLTTGEATWDEGLLLVLERRGYPEETYHTFSYSPLADDRGAIVGMLCVVTEETERVIGERRLACLNGLASDIAGTNTRLEVLAATERQLGTNAKDLPFTLAYLFDEQGTANLACATGVGLDHPIAMVSIDPADAEPLWPMDELVARRTVLTVGDLERRFGQVPTGAWDKPPREAVIAPILRPGQDTLAGFLVAATNPYRPSGEADLGFLGLIAGQLAAGLANADAYEAERRRVETLAAIDRAKTAFFSNVSHEFRTPLTLMLGPLEELLSAPVSGDLHAARPLVATAHRNAVRLLRLVNSLLDFSRIESGRVQATYEPTDLAALTADVASSFRSAVDKAGLRLIIDCSPLPEPVYLDRDMWETIVLNLLSNAFKFTFDGEIEVSVSATADRKAANLTVRDTGSGIPAQELPRLFDRFYRIEGARGRTFEGSGIGLALVQELAKQLGAKIAVRSKPGRGSTFIVTVPLGTAHLPGDQIVGARVSPATGLRAQGYVEEALRWLPDEDGVGRNGVETPSGSRAHDAPPSPTAGRVLLADDNADMRDYVRRLLVEEGYAVEAVADGEAAIVAARRHSPDLVLSDVMMPGLDGFGLLRALRDDEALGTIPIVLLSARAGEDASVEGLGRGADDYLTKPFTARELLARVGVNLRMARMRREAAEALRARSVELETVLATIPAAVWFTSDPEAQRVFGNRQANAWLRLPEGSNASISAPLEQRPSFRVFRAGREATLETIGIRRAALGEEVRDDEVEIRFDDDTSLTMLTNASPLRDRAGHIVGAVSAGIDITGRKRQEERFRQVVESAPSAMTMTGPDGVIVMVNAQSERMFGYTRQELLGQPIEILVPRAFRDAHPGLRRAFFAGPVSRPMGAGRDLHGLKKDGSAFPIEIGLSPIETDDGTMVLASIVDISERVRAARALARSEAEFRASFEGTAVGKVLADPLSERMLRANRAFAGMLGYESEDLVGRSRREFIWHEDLPLDEADHTRLLSGEEDAIVREMRYTRRDGSPFWVRASAAVTRPAGSADQTILVIAVEDIDTRHKAETALRIAKQELEQVVEERTEALNQRDLLLREVYHRVKNNLQLVDSLLMMQGRNIDDPRAKQALLSLRGRVAALGLVHEQLMGSADLKTFDVVPFLDDLSRNIMEGGGTNGVSMSVEACTLEVGLDFAVPLGLLVTELVTNSLKHAFPDGSGTISVILRNEDDRNLVLIVADDGVGQASAGVADNSKSGLGTRIITRLVDQLEGTITVRSETGTMTEIRIPMPMPS